MLKKQAIAIAHTLSKPSKMPCPSYSLPTHACATGSKLRNVPGSVCSICYAHERGSYAWNTTKEALEQRLSSLAHPDWTSAMVSLIRGREYFRWFDSGDIQGEGNLRQLIEIAEYLPETRFWLPTREYRLVRNVEFPANLTVRVASPMVDGAPLHWARNTSTVHKNREPIGFACPAYKAKPHQCGACRACWDRSIPNVSYPAH